MWIRRRVRLLAIASVASAALLAACTSSSGPSGNASSQDRVNGGTATVALSPGSTFSWILPMLNTNNAIGANIEYSEYLMWRPLYWFGSPNSVGLNLKYSMADAAVVKASGGNTTATVQLKPWHWSDGKPVTTRDVEFWFNLLKAEKANWWGYTVGQFPDNVTSFKILSLSRFSMTFKGTYSSTWLYNELGQIIPIPQQSWDKTSATGAIGNYDTTPSGAADVYKFLAAANGQTSTYATNPLWQVVDGPWKITSYAPSTGDATYVRNMKYNGPATGSLHELKVLSYTSDTAEFDSLLSAGGIDYGYIPYNDAAQVSRVTSDGYKVEAWPTWGITYINLNFQNAAAAPIFNQLYIRQAMQELINQAGYISSFLQGYGNATYGPVPLVPASKYVSAAEKSNPYPYNPANAEKLLREHGWKIVPHGADVCQKAGSGNTDCGAGITAGEHLSLKFLYSTGTQGVNEEVAALQSAYSQAGIQLTLSTDTFNNVISETFPCTNAHASSCWQMSYYGQGWYFDPGYDDPDGSTLFHTGGVSNGGSYSDPTADADMNALTSGSYPALYKYQDYLAKQLPVLWMPQFDSQISAVNSKLQGVYPQDPDSNIYPENWYFVK